MTPTPKPEDDQVQGHAPKPLKAAVPAPAGAKPTKAMQQAVRRMKAKKKAQRAKSTGRIKEKRKAEREKEVAKESPTIEGKSAAPSPRESAKNVPVVDPFSAPIPETTEAAPEQPPVALAADPEPKRDKGGRRPYQPTDADRMRVRTLAGLGMLQKEIRLLIFNPETGNPLKGETLKKYYARELAEGAPLANAKVAENIFKKATGDSSQSMRAAIWWETTRCGRGERVKLELEDKSGVLVAPGEMSVAAWVAQQAAKAAEKKKPGDEEPA